MISWQAAQFRTSASESSEHLFRRLLGAYLGGALTFEVLESPTVSESTRAVVRAFAGRTRGMEIVSLDDDRIRLNDDRNWQGASIPAGLHRLGTMVLAFHRRAAASWERLPLRDDGMWEALDDAIDREAWYLVRLIVLRPDGPAEAAETVRLWSTAHALERIADKAVALAQGGSNLVELGPESSTYRTLRQLHRQALVYLEETLQAGDAHTANQLVDVGEALLSSGRAVAEGLIPALGEGTLTPGGVVAVDRVLSAIASMVTSAQEIAETVLDQAVESVGAPPSHHPDTRVLATAA